MTSNFFLHLLEIYFTFTLKFKKGQRSITIMKDFLYRAIVIFLCITFGTNLYPSDTIERISTTTTNGDVVTVTALTPNIIKIENQRKNGDSFIIPASSTLKMTLTDLSNVIYLDTTTLTTPSGITVDIKETGAIEIHAPSMTIIDSGLRESTDGMQQIKLYAGQTGAFYGAGERGHSLNLRGDTLVMYNRQNYGYTKRDTRISQMNITMPLFISSEGYAIVFDDYAPATMILKDPIIYTSENTTPITYYVIYGNGSMEETTKHLSELIGRQDLPPLWGLGYITSKYGYRTQEETLAVIDTLKTAGYPVDAIVLDLYWYGEEPDMGRFDWDNEKWPDPRKMLDSLKQQGVNLIAISQPYILSNGKGIDNYNFLSENKMLVLDSAGATHPVEIWVGEGGMLDVSNPKTELWLKNRYKQLTDMGITGWWGDLGEPEVHPESAVHSNGLMARQYHNRYGNDWSRIIYNLFKEEYPDTRLMTMMRGGTTGLQQYSVFPWSTDVSRSWEGLSPQITIMLNSGLSGLGYMSHDVGGFAIDPDNPVDDELYIRWLQLGLFSPVFRTHSQHAAEPYLYKDWQDIILPIVRMRYQWLPYNYSLAYENSQKGYPLVRPIGYHSTTDTDNDTDIEDEFLWGRDVLVAPIITQGALNRNIKIPNGDSRWIDMNNPSHVYAGGTFIENYPVTINTIPLFVREGTFVPSAPYPMNNTQDYRTDLYRIDYYPLNGSESLYTLYEDDLKSPDAINKKEFLTISFEGKDNGKDIVIIISSEGGFPGMKKYKTFDFVIHGIQHYPRSITINNKPVSGNYDNNKEELMLTTVYRTGEIVKIKIHK